MRTNLEVLLLSVFVLSCAGQIDEPTSKMNGPKPVVPSTPMQPTEPEGDDAGSTADDAGVVADDAGLPINDVDLPMFECAAGTRPVDAPLKRVSEFAFRASVQSIAATLLGSDLAASQATLDEALRAVPADVAVPPEGDTHGGFRRMDQTIQTTWVEGAYGVAKALAQEATKTDARRARWAGTCATDTDTTNDAACVTAALQKLAQLTLRRPTQPEDVTALRGVLSPTKPLSASSLANAVAFSLLTPDFLYDVERAPMNDATGTVDVDDLALARRLASVVWQAAPDDALLTAARTGALRTEAGLRAQFRRLLADKKMERGIGMLFADWLRLQETPAFDAEAGTAPWTSQFGALHIDAQTRLHANQDVLESAFAAVRNNGGVADVLTDTHSYAREADVASLYGVAPWDGVGPAPQTQGRAGLISRPALVASGGVGTQPVLKGFRLRSALLCTSMHLPSDPAIAAAAGQVSLTAVGADQTTRERVTSITEVPGTACAGCHTTLLNPLGFATESYDGLGRTRTEELLYFANGTFAGRKPVNTRTAPHVVYPDNREVQTAAELTQRLVRSGRVDSCFVLNVFRYTFQRFEDESTSDSCLLAEAETLARSGAPIADVLERFVTSATFRQRVISR